MSDEVGRVALGVELTGTKLESQLNDMIGGIAKKAVGVLAAAFSVKKLAEFGKECIALGSDLSEVQNVVDVTFSTMSDKVNEFAQSAAGMYGLSETMAKKYVGLYGSMAEAFGFTEAQAYDMATALTGLAGDVASFYNLDQDTAYTKLKSVFSGETETLKDLGIVMTQTALDAYALANGYGKTTSAMTEAEKVSLRYAFVQSQLANATGDFFRTQDSWANQSRLLALQAQSAMAAIGQGLINLLRPALVALNGVMAKIVQLAGAFRDLMALLFGDAGSSATSTVASDLDTASNNADALTSGLNSAASAARDLQRQVMGFDQINKLSDTSSASDTDSSTPSGISSSSPILSGVAEDAGAATESISALGGVLSQVKTWLEGVDFSPLQNALKNLKVACGDLGGVLSGALQWGLEHVLEPLAQWGIEEAVPTVLNLLAAAIELLAAALEKAQPFIQWVWDNFLQPIAAWTADKFLSALQEVTDLLTDLTDLLTGGLSFVDFVAQLTPVQDILLGVAGALISIQVASGAVSVFNGISAAISTIIALDATSFFGKLAEVVLLTARGAGTLHEAFAAIFGSIGTALAGISSILGGAALAVTNFISMLQDGFSWINEALMAVGVAIAAVGAIILGAPALVAGVIAAIVAAVATAVVLVKEHWEEIKAFFIGAWEAIKNVWGTAAEWFSGVWNGIKSCFSGVADWFKNIFSSAWTAVKNVFSTGGKIFSGIVDGVASTFKSVVNKIIAGINKIIATPFNKINSMLNKIRNLSVLGVSPFKNLWKENPLPVPQIPALATGGVTDGPTAALIGEAGQEAVLPLERNTGWMDMLAEKLTETIANAVSCLPATVQVDAGKIARRCTPALACMRGGGNITEGLEADKSKADADFTKLLKLLELIYQWLKEQKPVVLDPDTLYRYFVQTHNHTVYQTGESPLKL